MVYIEQRLDALASEQTGLSEKVDLLAGVFGELSRRVDVLETVPVPVPAPIPAPLPPSDLEPRQPFVIDGKSGQTIKDFSVEMSSGNWAVILRNCSNMVIENYNLIGGGILVEGGSNNEIRPGSISRAVPGSSAWSDNEVGVRFLGTNKGSLLGSVVAYADCNVRAEDSSDILLDGNFTYNPRGPFPRGQHFQTWTYNGRPTRNIVIKNHYSLTDLGDSVWPSFQEDAMNFGGARGVRIENVLNEMVAAAGGSPTGSGLMFESTTGIVIDGFTSIGQANLGLGVYNHSVVDGMDNVLSIVDRNPRANQAMTVAQGSTVTFGENVRLYGIKPDGSPYGTFWTDGTVTLYGLENVRRGVSGTLESNTARDAVVRPPLPAVGFVKAG